jgi:hypothetical protein
VIVQDAIKFDFNASDDDMETGLCSHPPLREMHLSEPW